MNYDWKKTIAKTVVFALGAVITALAGNRSDELGDRLKTASDDELSDEYEERRQEWIKTGLGGNGEKTPEMKRIEREMSRRSAERWEKNPHRNTDPNYRWTDANRWDND